MARSYKNNTSRVKNERVIDVCGNVTSPYPGVTHKKNPLSRVEKNESKEKGVGHFGHNPVRLSIIRHDCSNYHEKLLDLMTKFA